jgi:ElaB/YqjD/DUF883 family membrane-anchored ribosome-binding protein
MISKTSDSKDANTSSANKNSMDDLKVTNGEVWSGLAGDHTGTEADAASAGVLQNLQVVRDSMVAAETALIQHSGEATKASGEYVRDNVWNWY